jgi:hypothetical protein
MSSYPNPLRSGVVTSVDTAWSKLVPALAGLSIELMAQGQPPPPIRAVLELPRGDAADATIALVRAVFRLRIYSGALTLAAKRAGNAARGVRRALAYEDARRARVALAEMRPAVRFP